MVGALLVVAGLFSVGLGLVHLVIPRLFDFERAIGDDAAVATPLTRRSVGR